jgi:hypothetical protein
MDGESSQLELEEQARIRRSMAAAIYCQWMGRVGYDFPETHLRTIAERAWHAADMFLTTGDELDE